MKEQKTITTKFFTCIGNFPTNIAIYRLRGCQLSCSGDFTLPDQVLRNFTDSYATKAARSNRPTATYEIACERYNNTGKEVLDGASDQSCSQCLILGLYRGYLRTWKSWIAQVNNQIISLACLKISLPVKLHLKEHVDRRLIQKMT